MAFEADPWAAALAVLVAWILVVFGGLILQFGRGTRLERIVSELNYPLIAAPVFLLAVAAYTGKWRAFGLQLDSDSNFSLLIAPAIAIIALWIFAFRNGVTWNAALKFAGANTLLVGFSEELMFRGVLFYGALSNFGTIWAAAISAAIFGGVHLLNGALTGNWTQAAEQALINVFTGFWLGALRAKLSTIIPLVVIHWLWDFALFTAGTKKSMSVKSASLSGAVPLACDLVLFLYAIWLVFG
ncbi:CPBP family intramembrane glutamic endopeptidase [Methylocystis parvus]|uniref:CPBP family intramembrane glutamic endopeptidase n=1 Tax=Methylocystis parvus TaxID=134 RepID=UPI003C7340CC